MTSNLLFQSYDELNHLKFQCQFYREEQKIIIDYLSTVMSLVTEVTVIKSCNVVGFVSRSHPINDGYQA